MSPNFFHNTNDLLKLGIKAGKNCKVHSTVMITEPKNVVLGDNVRIDSFTSIVSSSKVKIESFIHIGSHVLLHAGQKGIELKKIGRGGDITYHGPGQIVCYPIFDLENFFTDIHKYLRTLEFIVVKTLKKFGIASTGSEDHTGVWIDKGTLNERKICALGIKASRWVTKHGLALNVNTDLSYFEGIIPCGLKDKAVTSMSKEIGLELNTDEVVEELVKQFEKEFKN